MKTTDYFYCRKCIYLSCAGNEKTCDYIGKTGHMRGCPAGVGCNRRVNGEKKRPSPMGGAATQHAYRKEKTNGNNKN